MPGAKPHIVQKQFIEVLFRDLENSMGMQHRMAELFYERLQPRMADLFDELCREQQTIRIEKLVIDCGVLPTVSWEEEWVETTLRNLKAELLVAHRERLGNDEEKSEWQEAFFYYVQHGRLPWNTSLRSVQEMELFLSFQQDFLERLKAFITEKPVVTRRLVNSFSAPFRQRLLTAFSKGHASNPQHLQVLAALFPHLLPAVREEAEFKALSVEAADRVPALLQQLHQATGANANEAAGTNSETMQRSSWERAEEPATKQDIEGIYITNAGLVLLHPFLPELFTHNGLWANNKWAAGNAVHTAVRTLHFLVWGEDAYNEKEWPLSKLLCGMEVDAVVEDVKPLTGAAKEAAYAMLQAVIGHWAQLKNTSMDALRQTFLQRAGKLSRVDDGWLLQIEQKGVDVLLSYLPWGIGLIKLPWMTELLYVEWG